MNKFQKFIHHGHYYCKKCLETHYTRNNIKCPYWKRNNESDLSLIIY